MFLIFIIIHGILIRHNSLKQECNSYRISLLSESKFKSFFEILELKGGVMFWIVKKKMEHG